MKKSRIEINGSGTVATGVYDEIEINGSGKIEGVITCGSLTVNGAAKAYESVEAKSIHISGSFKVDDHLKADMIEVDGSFKGEKDVRVNRLIIAGSFKNENGYLNAEYIEVDGTLKNELEINVDRLVVNGLIKAKDIVGRDIAILKQGLAAMFLRINLAKRNQSKAETITCETLYAAALKCNKVCAEDITLKNGCTIDIVECNGTLRVDESCIIRKIEGDCEIIHEA